MLRKNSGETFFLKKGFPEKNNYFLFFVFAVEFFEVFVVNERLLAVRADDIFRIYGIVEENLAVAVRAERAVEFFVIIVFVVAVAIAIAVIAITVAAVAVTVVVIVAVAAAAAIVIIVVVIVDVVNDFFNRAEVFVDFFDVCVAGFNLCGQSVDFVCHLGSKFRESEENLAFRSVQVDVCAFDEALDICAVFLGFHIK